ncbi:MULTISPECIES: LLM class flavin-dependent oxidoreductase [unclassified Streptomyces]|uniref:LLM class flavin-dependent oxidoreductase n=1 Tax=unclassified Streptomyces TaxID=2593676 RepID=UPI00038230D9|nr:MULTISPECIES: LLM class flavin-dependent oxidoreductase [unclassified Streptomyces]MYX35718.1 LLM class flavin-dependent oxidoreductase [Streptomyces sp. SID8377]
MPDYGHELLLGTFITPTAQDPARAVALAELTEAAQLDVATFQDHPYNADFLDTYTLLTWVAARTSRIHVSANVTNLPLRPPAMLARTAASIDVLSGGRFELGLGAGAFPDAVHGMGGPRLSPGQGVEALDEAIDILRGAWDSGERGSLRFQGEHYTVPSMKRGPRPSHDISVWLGAYKPRMLSLTGRKANGWLPTLEYLRTPGMTEANKIIDDAAHAEGRDPKEIRRLLNLFSVDFTTTRRGHLQGPPRQWVEELLPLVLEQGFSAFLIGRDDPRLIRTFGEEVAPALREAVARERSTAPAGTGTVPDRTAVVLAGRRDTIDYDAVPESLAQKVVEPGDPAYEDVRHSYIHSGSPALVIRAENADDVVAALAYARAQNVALSVRSGGHGISGRSTNDGGIVIDLSKMNSVEVLDRTTGRIRVGPGARWGHVARALAPHGLAMSSGDYGDVGVGGLATAGGLGYLARKHGLTIDHVTAAEIVVADGRRLRVDAEHHPELFWAIRGAGGNFGIVTAFELQAYEVENVAYATLVVDATDTADFLLEWGRLVEAAPREITSFISLFPGHRGGPVTAQITLVYAGDDIEDAQNALTPFMGAGPVLDQQAQLVPYHLIVAPPENQHRGQGLGNTRSGLLDHITPEAAAIVEKAMKSGDVMVMQFRSMGGAVHDIPEDAMAWSHRTQNFSVIAATASSHVSRMNAHWARLYPHLNGMYPSFETDTDPARLADAFPEPVLTRLRALKAAWDPDNVFNRNFAIPPAAPSDGAAHAGGAAPARR